ncbi:tetratricopeptide repeat protein 16 [Python bivittatus]|uniref:Tetratricopeptide repeat protein 16 n=1 Tax=Python bivittatus TaxID=176946 RepID=A0A9F3QSV3_PYTBI|nr:tetratricopeptide repeat protein 16 [Python bivittatus]
MEDEEEVEEPKAKPEVKMTTIILGLFPTAVTEEKLHEAREKSITRIFGPAKTLLKVKNPEKVGDFEGILQKKIEEHCQEGHTYFSQGEWEKAITCYTKALNLDPNKGELYEKKAEAFVQLCDFQSAAVHLRKVYCMTPREDIQARLAFILYVQGQSLYEQKVYLDALESFTHACELQPQNTLYHMRSIACLAAMNRFNDCLQMVNEEVEREKKNADLFVLRARLYEYFGKASPCFCNIQEALRLDPEHVEAQLLLAKLTQEAERSKDCAVTLAVGSNLKAALLKINRAIDYNPLDAKYFLFRGSLLRRLKDFSAAIDDYLKAVELCQTEEADEVRREAEKQVLLTYNDFAVHCYLKGCYEEAVLLLNKAIKGEKNEWGLYVNRGDCFLKLGQLNFAMADYEQALELRPLDHKLRQRIAWLYDEAGLQDFRHKQYLQAESNFSSAVENNPREIKYYLHRAKSRMFLQEVLGAKEDIICALLLDPTRDEAQTLTCNLFPGESIDSLLNSKAGDFAKSLLDQKLKAFPAYEALQRPLKPAGSESPSDVYVQIEDLPKAEAKAEAATAKEEEEVSEEKKLQRRLADCQQKSNQADQELKEALKKKPTLVSNTARVDPCPCLPPKECPNEPYCWRKFREGIGHF